MSCSSSEPCCEKWETIAGPITITRSGNYRLSADFEGPIVVMADDTVIDMCGKTITPGVLGDATVSYVADMGVDLSAEKFGIMILANTCKVQNGNFTGSWSAGNENTNSDECAVWVGPGLNGTRCEALKITQVKTGICIDGLEAYPVIDFVFKNCNWSACDCALEAYWAVGSACRGGGINDCSSGLKFQNCQGWFVQELVAAQVNLDKRKIFADSLKAFNGETPLVSIIDSMNIILDTIAASNWFDYVFSFKSQADGATTKNIGCRNIGVNASYGVALCTEVENIAFENVYAVDVYNGCSLQAFVDGTFTNFWADGVGSQYGGVGFNILDGCQSISLNTLTLNDFTNGLQIGAKGEKESPDVENILIDGANFSRMRKGFEAYNLCGFVGNNLDVWVENVASFEDSSQLTMSNVKAVHWSDPTQTEDTYSYALTFNRVTAAQAENLFISGFTFAIGSNQTKWIQLRKAIINDSMVHVTGVNQESARFQDVICHFSALGMILYQDRFGDWQAHEYHDVTADLDKEYLEAFLKELEVDILEIAKIVAEVEKGIAVWISEADEVSLSAFDVEAAPVSAAHIMTSTGVELAGWDVAGIGGALPTKGSTKGVSDEVVAIHVDGSNGTSIRKGKIRRVQGGKTVTAIKEENSTGSQISENTISDLDAPEVTAVNSVDCSGSYFNGNKALLGDANGMTTNGFVNNIIDGGVYTVNQSAADNDFPSWVDNVTTLTGVAANQLYNITTLFK